MKAFLLLLPVGLMLAGCGRVGPVQAPGPVDRITYPRAYPAPDRPRQPPAAPPATVQQTPLAPIN